MLIEEALASVLTNDYDLTNIVGQSIHAVTIPQDQAGKTNQYPAVVYALSTRRRSDTHDGPDGLTISEFQIDCLSAKYSECKHVAEAVVNALHGKHELFNTTIGARKVGRVVCEDEADDFLYDPVEKLSLFDIQQRFQIHHRD